MNLAGSPVQPCPLAGWPAGAYPEVRQLQGDLHEGVGAGPALLDEALAEGQELEAVQFHVICQRLGHLVGTLDDRLALPRHGKGQLGAEFLEGQRQGPSTSSGGGRC